MVVFRGMMGVPNGGNGKTKHGGNEMKTNKHTDIRNENGTYRDWVINDIDFDCDELDEWNILHDATDDNGDALPDTLDDTVDAMGTHDTQHVYETHNLGVTMFTRNMKHMFMVGMVGMVLASGCSQTDANEIAANTDGKLENVAVAIGTELDKIGEHGEQCQLGALSRQMGNDNKLAFLARIKSGCAETSTSAKNDWQSVWNENTDMTFAAWKLTQ